MPLRGGTAEEATRRVLAGVAILTAARLWLIGAVGLGDDEAYYWTWSRHLAAGYRDHPPGVAWLVAAGTALGGDGGFGVRWPFVVVGLLATAALVGLGRGLAGDRRADAWTLAAVQLCPLFGVATVFAAPDMPFLAAWSAAWLAAWHARERPRLWLAAGALAGVAALFKFHAVLLPLGFLGLLAGRPWRAALRSPWPWLGALLAALLASPVFAWNAAHGWPTFAFQLVERQRVGARPGLAGLGTFLGSQLAWVSPLLALGALAALGRALARRRRAEPRDRLLAWAAGPTLLLFALQSTWAPFKAHWAAGAWLVLLPAAGAPLRRAGRHLPALALVLAGGLTALVYVQARTPVLRVEPPRLDVTHELWGWDAAAARALALRNEMPDPERTFVAGHMYQVAAQLEHALAVRAEAAGGAPPPVFRLGPRHDQYDLRPPPPAGWDAILVTHDTYDLDAGAHAAELGFAACTLADALPVERGGRVVRVFRFWRCRAR